MTELPTLELMVVLGARPNAVGLVTTTVRPVTARTARMLSERRFICSPRPPVSLKGASLLDGA
jgi:hypothetical protein